jgi:DUF1009 family protein
VLAREEITLQSLAAAIGMEQAVVDVAQGIGVAEDRHRQAVEGTDGTDLQVLQATATADGDPNHQSRLRLGPHHQRWRCI